MSIHEIVPLEQVEQGKIEDLLRQYQQEREKILSNVKWESESEILGALGNKTQTGFAAVSPTGVAGFILFREYVGTLLVTHFFVSPENRGHDLGKKLLENVKARVLQRKDLTRLNSALIPELADVRVDVLAGMGFQTYERYEMVRKLSDSEFIISRLQDPLKIVPLADRYVWPLAETLHSASRDITDRDLRPGVFDTPWTCFLFLRQIVKGYYGVFNYHTCFLALEGEKVLGGIFGTYRLNGESFIPAFFISREYQGRGLGQLLLNSLLQKLKECGTLRVSLCVTSSNEAACALYRKCGFYENMKYYEIVFDKKVTL